jgi:hypothetical protein
MFRSRTAADAISHRLCYALIERTGAERSAHVERLRTAVVEAFVDKGEVAPAARHLCKRSYTYSAPLNDRSRCCVIIVTKTRAPLRPCFARFAHACCGHASRGRSKKSLATLARNEIMKTR